MGVFAEFEDDFEGVGSVEADRVFDLFQKFEDSGAGGWIVGFKFHDEFAVADLAVMEFCLLGEDLELEVCKQPMRFVGQFSEAVCEFVSKVIK